MNNLKNFYEKRNAAVEELEALKNTIATETRAFTEDEQTKFDTLVSDIRNLDKTIANLKEEFEMSTETMTEERAVEPKATETVEEREIREFAAYIRGMKSTEGRAATNMDKNTSGAAVPDTIINKIIAHIYEVSPLLEKMTRFDIVGNIKVPTYGESGDAAITVAFVEDGTPLTSHVGTITNQTLTDYTCGALALIGKSLLKDTDLNLVTFVVTKMAEAMARFWESAVIKGATVDASHSISGLTAVGNDMTITAASATAVTINELIQCENLLTSSLAPKGIWIMSRATFGAIKQLADQNGRLYMVPFQDGITSGFGWTLLGHPVFVTDQIDAMAAGKRAIFFLDPECVAMKTAPGSYELQVLTERFADSHCYGAIIYSQFDAKIIQPQGVACIKMATQASKS